MDLIFGELANSGTQWLHHNLLKNHENDWKNAVAFAAAYGSDAERILSRILFR